MGLPQVDIDFKTLSTTAIQRSSKGVVALVLADDKVTTFTTKIYTSIADVATSDWSAAK